MGWLGTFPKHRILFSRLFALGLLLALVFTRKPYLQHGWEPVGHWTGFLLLMASMLGRLWSLLFLSGYKTRQVVDSGPFSMVRNPLYLFSFLGALGFVLVANHLWVAVAVLLAFLLYYPFVVLSEEAGLRKRLGAEYEAYCRRVPRFLPRFSLYQRPEAWDVRLKGYDSAWRDALWFPVVFLLLSLLKAWQSQL